MVSLATYTRLSAQPAAFSREIVTGLLRSQLHFDGAVISDDLGQAGAVKAVPVGDRAVRFLSAGGTLILVVPASHLPVMQRAVLDRCASDPAFADLVDKAAAQALRAKAGAGLL